MMTWCKPHSAGPQVLGGTVQNLVTTPPSAWDVCTSDLQNLKTL
jgi:hypothetical protein